MNFDPVSYALHVQERQADRIRLIEQYVETAKVDRARLEVRLDALEAFHQRMSALLSRWPMVVGIVVLVALNVAPKETVEAVVAGLRAIT
jgi:hypothetical protein